MHSPTEYPMTRIAVASFVWYLKMRKEILHCGPNEMPGRLPEALQLSPTALISSTATITFVPGCQLPPRAAMYMPRLLGSIQPAVLT
jgi:hypothetical protein